MLKELCHEIYHNFGNLHQIFWGTNYVKYKNNSLKR